MNCKFQTKFLLCCFYPLFVCGLLASAKAMSTVAGSSGSMNTTIASLAAATVSGKIQTNVSAANTSAINSNVTAPSTIASSNTIANVTNNHTTTNASIAATTNSSVIAPSATTASNVTINLTNSHTSTNVVIAAARNSSVIAPSNTTASNVTINLTNSYTSTNVIAATTNSSATIPSAITSSNTIANVTNHHTSTNVRIAATSAITVRNVTTSSTNSHTSTNAPIAAATSSSVNGTPAFSIASGTTNSNVSKTTINLKNNQKNTTRDSKVNTKATTTTIKQHTVCVKASKCIPNFCKHKSSYCVIIDGEATCKCKPGYFQAKSGICKYTKTFGGKLFLNPGTRKRSESEDQKNSLRNMLNEVYGNSSEFISVNVVRELKPNVWMYELFFEVESEVNEDTVSQALNQYFEESKVCKDNICAINGLSVVKDASVNNAGNNDVVCIVNAGYCDEVSTSCKASGGFVNCDCQTKFVFLIGNDRFCEKKICEVDADCKSLLGYGSCKSKNDSYDTGKCLCILGFSGGHCKNAWLFAFFVSAGVTAILVLVGILVCVLKKRRCCEPNHVHARRSTLRHQHSNFSIDSDDDSRIVKSKYFPRKKLTTPTDKYESIPHDF